MKMNQEILLTVSIAAYNAEDTLRETLESLCASSELASLEILVVNDGSRDATSAVARDYQRRFPDAVRVIDKENGGHGSTINVGMREASGKYFKVIDGDDWVDTKLFDRFIRYLSSHDDDIIVTSYQAVSREERRLVNPFKNCKEGKRYFLSKLPSVGNITLHTLTVRTDLLKRNGIKITEKCYYVDIEFVVWVVYISENMSYMNYPLYCYRIGQENQSVSKKTMLRNVDMQKRVVFQLGHMLSDFIRENDIPEQKMNLIKRRMSRSVLAVYRTYLLESDLEKSRRGLKRFDSEIRSKSFDLYQFISRDLFYRVLIFGNYRFLPIIRSVYQKWCGLQ